MHQRRIRPKQGVAGRLRLEHRLDLRPERSMLMVPTEINDGTHQ